MKPTPNSLLAGQVIAQLSVLGMFFATPMEWAITFFMYCGIMLGITVAYHRYWSHYCFTAPNWFVYLMTFFAHIMMVGPALAWSAQHREHHKFADTEKDPHSPEYRGFIRCYFSQVKSLPKMKFVTDLLRNDFLKAQHRYYWHVIVAWAATLFLIDPFAVVYAWLAPAGFAKLIGSIVFIHSHRGGKPRSDHWLGIATLGEGYHSNHHKSPWDWRFHKYDVGGMLIGLFEDTFRISK